MLKVSNVLLTMPMTSLLLKQSVHREKQGSETEDRGSPFSLKFSVHFLQNSGRYT